MKTMKNKYIYFYEFPKKIQKAIIYNYEETHNDLFPEVLPNYTYKQWAQMLLSWEVLDDEKLKLFFMPYLFGEKDE